MFYSGRIQQFAQPELVCPIDNLKMKQKLSIGGQFFKPFMVSIIYSLQDDHLKVKAC